MPPTPEPPAATASPVDKTLFITLVVATAMFMEMFDSTVIITALPTMARDFDATVVSLSLGLTSYLLATAVLLPASGWLADRFGTRTVFCLAVLAFTLSSIWCGMARDVNEFVAARCLQGVGAALMSPVGRLLVLRTTPRDKMINVLNLLIVPGLIGPVIAPPIGGLITTYASWRWCFFINVPIGAVILYLMYRNTPNLRDANHKRFDWLGFVLNGSSLGSLIYGFDQLNEHWPGNLFSYMLIAVGVVLLALALRHALRDSAPLFRLDAARIDSFRVGALTAGSIARLSVMSLTFLMPLMFQIGLGMSAFHSGLLLLMHTGGDLTAKSFTNPFMNRFGFRRTLLGSAIGFAACIGLCLTFTHSTSYYWIGGLLFIGGMVRSLQLGSLGALQFADIAPSEMTDASTFSNITQQICRAFGVTLGALLLNVALSLRDADTAHSLSLFDFQLGFGVMALLSLSTVLWYLRMDKNIGAQLVTYRHEK